MSRRIALFVLAASATLIANQAVADRECFENSCRLPDVTDPPVQAAPAPVAEESKAPEAAAPEAARAEGSKPATARSKVQTAHKLAPASEPPQAAAEPSRQPLAMTPSPVADSEPARLAMHDAVRPRTEEARPRPRVAAYAQAEATPPPAYVVGGPVAVGSVLVAVPGVIYPGYGLRPIYMFAPNAKIISVDTDD